MTGVFQTVDTNLQCPKLKTETNNRKPNSKNKLTSRTFILHSQATNPNNHLNVHQIPDCLSRVHGTTIVSTFVT